MTATLLDPQPHATRPQALRCRVVRRHLGLQGLGQIADAATAVTLTRLLLLERNGPTAGEVTAGIAASVMPAVLSLPLAWAIADSLRRNASLAAAHVARAAIAVAAMLVPLTSSRTLGFAIVAAITAMQTICGSLRSASLGHAVSSERLMAANSLAAVTGKAAGTIGLALVVALHFVSPIVCFSLAALLHLGTAIGYLTWRTDLGGRGGDVRIANMTAFTSIAAWRRPDAMKFVPTTIALRAVQGATMVSFVAILERRYGGGSAATTAALAMTSAGAFLGMALAPNYWRWHPRPLVRRGALLVLISTTFGSLALPAAPICLIGQFLLSAAFGALKVRADSAIQANTDSTSRGRTVATHDAAYHVAFVTGAVLAIVNPYAGRMPGLSLIMGVGLVVVAGSRWATHRRGETIRC